MYRHSVAHNTMVGHKTFRKIIQENSASSVDG